MDTISNAQLMNAIKHLTRKVEALQEDIATLKGTKVVQSRKPAAGSHKLPADWKYPTVTQEIVDAVLNSVGLKDAAASLGLTDKKLTELLQKSGVPHLFGEKWSIALKRAINNEPIEDKFEYPEEWFEKKEKIKAHIEKYNLTQTSAKLEAPRHVVGRFVQLHCQEI